MNWWKRFDVYLQEWYANKWPWSAFILPAIGILIGLGIILLWWECTGILSE